MRTLIMTLAVSLITLNVFADVCQIKPHKDSVPSINVWALKKGSETVATYTYNDVDLDAGVDLRNSLISQGHCDAEPRLEKCQIKIERADVQGQPHYYVNVYVGNKVARSLGGLPQLDEYSINLGDTVLATLVEKQICAK